MERSNAFGPHDDQKNILEISTFKHVILLDQVPRQNPQSLPCRILTNLSKLDWSQIWKIFFYSKSCKANDWKESVPEARIQSCKHISASTVFGVNWLRKSDIFSFQYWKLTQMRLLMQKKLRHHKPYEKEWDTQLSYSSTKRVCQKFHFEGLEASLNKLHCAT